MKKKIAIAVLLSVFVAAPAMADNTGKFYVAADLGKASYSNVVSIWGPTFPNPSVFRVAGGYHVSGNVAVELGYSNFGDSTIDYGSTGKEILSLTSMQFAAVGSYPLSTELDLIGKLGIANNNVDYQDTGFAISASSSKTSLMFGLGAQYHVNQQLSLRALYDNYGAFDDSADPIKATSFTVGVAYAF